MASPPRALVAGVAGLELGEAERDLFARGDPLGFILFAHNVDSPDQVRALVADLRAAVGRVDAPVLIDQEGGRVQRLRPPHWFQAPPPGTIAALLEEQAAEAARLSARLIADDLHGVGVTVDCAPVLDVPQADADPVIGDRAAGRTPEQAARLGRAFCDGLLAGGVLPTVKHIPGHGRARADSHKELPVVTTRAAELAAVDFAPFTDLAGMPWAMTAHVVYAALDPDRPATTSPTVVDRIIRQQIGFDGVLISDDLAMDALSGSLPERAAAVAAAGCDVVLYCNTEKRPLADMAAVLDACPPLTPAAVERLRRAEAMRRAPAPFDRPAAEARLAALLEGGG